MSSVQPFFAETSTTVKWMLRASLWSNLLLIGFCAGYLILTFERAAPSWYWIAAALLCGYFLADFVSGVIHWAMDTWFDEPTLGRAVAVAREHHTHPQNILGYRFIDFASLGSAPSAAVFGPVALVTALFPVSAATYIPMICLLVLSLCMLFGTSFHNLCHLPDRPLLLCVAQRLHLVLPPAEHWVHHRGDHTVNYCVINGWANYVCDPLRVWRGLEWLIQTLTGAEPRRDDVEWQRRYDETGTLVVHASVH